MNDEIEESKAFAIKAAVCSAAATPALLIILHFIAAMNHVDFTVVKEVELLLGCAGCLSCVIAWAFKK